MADHGFTVSTDQHVSSDEDIDVIINGSGAVPYVVDLDVDFEQHVAVEQLSEIDLDVDDACAGGLELAVDVDQEAYLEQSGEIDIDIEEDNGLVSVDLELDIVQTIRIEDAIRIDAADGDDWDEDENENDVRLDVDQDVTTVQKLDLDIDIEDEILALVNVDADQCATLFQEVGVLVDLSSGNFVVDVDTVQDADLDDTIAISFDIRDVGQVHVAQAVAAGAGTDAPAASAAAGPGERPVIGGLGSAGHSVAAGGSAVAGLSAGIAAAGTFNWGGGGDLPGGGDSRAGTLSSEAAVAPDVGASDPGAESLRWTPGGGIVGPGNPPAAALSEARSAPDSGTVAVEPGGLAADAIAAMQIPADALVAYAGLLLAGRISNQKPEDPESGAEPGGTPRRTNRKNATPREILVRLGES